MRPKRRIVTRPILVAELMIRDRASYEAAHWGMTKKLREQRDEKRGVADVALELETGDGDR